MNLNILTSIYIYLHAEMSLGPYSCTFFFLVNFFSKSTTKFVISYMRMNKIYVR